MITQHLYRIHPLTPKFNQKPIQHTTTPETHRLDDVGPLEEAVLASGPEGQVTLAVGDQQVVVQRVERRPRQVLLQGLHIQSHPKPFITKNFSNLNV